MHSIIFSINTEQQTVTLANFSFKKLFSQITELPYSYDKDKEFLSIEEDALSSLSSSSLGSFFLNKEEVLYSFYIDRINEHTILFYGDRYDNEKYLKNEYLHKLLRLLSDNLPDMLWAKDVKGQYIFTNQAVCNNLLIAKNTQEPLGKTDVFFAKRQRELHLEDKNWHTFGELCFNSDEVVLENMRAMRFEEHGHVKGKMLYLEVHKAPFIDHDGRLLGTVGSGRDITQEVLSNQKLKENEQLMLHQSKMAAIGEMLQNIAHQWRQPLSSISSQSSGLIVQEQLKILDKKTLINALESILNTVSYLSKTIDDFRDFFKPEKEKRVVDSTQLINKLLLLTAARIKKHNVEVISNIEELKITTYENEFLQVLINLLNNAMDALSEHQVERKLIFITILHVNEKIKVIIKDNANGINESVIDNIFEPYFTTKHQKQGTGIGLYMSNEIITKHMNGHIYVKNVQYSYEDHTYRGAEFTIII